MAGRATTPMVSVAAALTPVIAAKSTQITTTPMAMPPLNEPDQRCMVSKRASAIPDFSIKSPMAIKSGIATRTMLHMQPNVL